MSLFHSCPLLSNSLPDSYQDILVPSEVKVVKDLEWLNDSFCNLLVDLRTKIDISDNRLLRKIAYCIDAEECYTIKGLAAVKEPNELFDLIRPHYNLSAGNNCKIYEACRFLCKNART